MNIFYCDHIIEGEALLSPDESAHCTRVLRLGRGDKVQVIDGHGGYFNAVIAYPDPKQCRIQILDKIGPPNARNYNIHIAIAPTKNMDRFEWFIEKAVEIGIDTITPLLCHRSERRVLKTERLQKLIISTMKQAVILFRPKLHELTDFNSFADSLSDSALNRYIAHCAPTGREKLFEVCPPERDVIAMIGPEGDFSPEEIAFAVKCGFTAVSLGSNRLRTETAGMVACHTVYLVNEKSK